ACAGSSRATMPLPARGCPRRGSHQILLRNGRAQTVVLADELGHEVVQPRGEDLLDRKVVKLRQSEPGLPLARALAAIGVGELVEIAAEILVAGGQRARHLAVE